MKNISWALIVVGVLGIVSALGMPISREGANVVNLALLAMQTNLVTIFSVVLGIGALLKISQTVSGRDSAAGGPQPSDASNMADPAIRRQHQIFFNGQRDIKLPAYQLFLIKRFAIEKNNTLEKFVIGDDVFHDLRSALIKADAKYIDQLEEVERLERVTNELLAGEKARAERNAREKKLGAQMSAQDEQRLWDDSWKSIREATPWVIGVVLFAVLFAVVFGVLFEGWKIW